MTNALPKSDRAASGALTIALALAAAIFVSDRASKWFVVEHLDLRSLGAIDVSAMFNLRMAWNTGVNFGIFADNGEAVRWALIAIGLAASVALIIWTLRSNRRSVAIGAGMIIGGALGNVWDRVVYGAVADFLNVTCCGLRNPWAFNIADVAIFAGVFYLILFDRPGDEAKTAG